MQTKITKTSSSGQKERALDQLITFVIFITILWYMFDYCPHPTNEEVEAQII